MHDIGRILGGYLTALAVILGLSWIGARGGRQ